MKDEFCIDASVIGQPGLGAMGFHAVNPTLMGPNVDPLNPPILLIDGEGKVMAVEYFVPAVGQPTPTIFGETFTGPNPPPAPGLPVNFSLHVWLIDNPSDQFADFNPSASCPAGSLPPPMPMLISAAPPATGDAPLPWLYIMLAGGAIMLAGLGLRRWATRNA
jgi:hypothetical protein